MFTMPDFGFDGLSSSLVESMSIYFFSIFFPTFFLYHVQVCNPDTTDRRHHAGSAGCVLQPAGYNTIHACRLPAEQEATPHACGSFSALYYCCGFLSNGCFCYRTLRSEPAGCGSLLLRDTCVLPVLQHIHFMTS